MVEVTITEAQANLIQLLDRVQQGEEIIITPQGEAIARLSALTKVIQRLGSHAALRATQAGASSSSLEHLQALREEARY